MDNLVIKQSSSSPAISADWNTGVISMKGDSYPENSFELFAPLIDWVEAFLDQANRPLQLNLELVYLNTSSIRSMMDIFDQMEVAHKKGQSVNARWTYEAANERVGQLAEEFREDCTFPFTINVKS